MLGAERGRPAWAVGCAMNIMACLSLACISFVSIDLVCARRVARNDRTLGAIYRVRPNLVKYES